MRSCDWLHNCFANVVIFIHHSLPAWHRDHPAPASLRAMLDNLAFHQHHHCASFAAIPVANCLLLPGRRYPLQGAPPSLRYRVGPGWPIVWAGSGLVVPWPRWPVSCFVVWGCASVMRYSSHHGRPSSSPWQCTRTCAASVFWQSLSGLCALTLGSAPTGSWHHPLDIPPATELCDVHSAC